MGGGRVVVDNYEKLGIDKKEYDKRINEDKEELANIIATIKKGSGVKPEKLKIYNKFQKYKFQEEPITTRQYLSDYFMQRDVDIAYYEVQSTMDFLKEIFDIDIDLKEATKVSYRIFQLYYEGDSSLCENIEECKKILKIIKKAHMLSSAKINNAIKVLEDLGEEIPSTLKVAKRLQDKYAKKNQLPKAIIKIVQYYFPEINDKNILNKIVAKALQ